MADFGIIDAESNTKAFKSAGNIGPNTRKGVRKAFFKIGKDLISTFNEQVLRGKKTGRIYIRKDRLGRGRRHRASAAGESPANRTGNYRRNVGFLNQTTQLTFGIRGVPYALHLETGTSRMKARPGLGNAVGASERNIIRDLESGISNEL